MAPKPEDVTVDGFKMVEHIDTFTHFEVYVDSDGDVWILDENGEKLSTSAPNHLSVDEVEETAKVSEKHKADGDERMAHLTDALGDSQF